MAKTIRPETRLEFRRVCDRLQSEGFVPSRVVHQDLPAVKRGIQEAFVEFAPKGQTQTGTPVRIYAPKIK